MVKPLDFILHTYSINQHSANVPMLELCHPGQIIEMTKDPKPRRRPQGIDVSSGEEAWELRILSSATIGDFPLVSLLVTMLSLGQEISTRFSPEQKAY